MKSVRKYNKRYSIFSKISHLFSFWLASINLVLIVLVNPSIINPGPNNHHNISVLYQNVRGLIPFNYLGKPSPMLDNTKMCELQSYVYYNKIDIVVLNETWLVDGIKNEEIFPSNAYKIFRLDRSIISHPPHPDNPNKYRRNGGGVLIAVRSDLDVISKKIKLSCNAEILTLQVTLKNKKTFYISTCYRVGTLEDENHTKIDKYLKKIASINKISAHVLVGDFNLCNTQWPDDISINNLETKFLNTFQDVNMTQFISSPTHEDGRILDILLCNTLTFVTNIYVLEKNQVCKSDHFAIKFSITLNIKRIKCPKRKLYNYKKANWNQLNNDIRHVKWDRILKGRNA